jgi:hypothetical protein
MLGGVDGAIHPRTLHLFNRRIVIWCLRRGSWAEHRLDSTLLLEFIDGSLIVSVTCWLIKETWHQFWIS